MNSEALTVLRALCRSGGRLHGRLERAEPFLLTDAEARRPVELQVVEELFDAGWIEIDEAAPIGEVYCFQISQAGTAYVQSIS